jgi:IS5 family transposase
MLEEAGIGELLKMTIGGAIKIMAVRPIDFERVIIDSAVVEKAVVYPTDCTPPTIPQYRLVKSAK